MIRSALCAFAACTAFVPVALAQTYPTKPIRMIVPFPAGGATDIVARLIGQKLSESMGQQVIADNRGGAGGTIGTDVAAKSPPDGYTILIGTSSTHAVAPGLYTKLPYDPVRDFTPVTLLATATILLAAHPSIPAKNVKELIAIASASRTRCRMRHRGTAASRISSARISARSPASRCCTCRTRATRRRSSISPPAR
jgi:tripartite-type tricarboxylate transporter receptor subunit TctC